MCILIASFFCESVDETDVDADGSNACEAVTDVHGNDNDEVDGENDGLVNVAADDAACKADGDVECEDFIPTFTGKRLLLGA